MIHYIFNQYFVSLLSLNLKNKTMKNIKYFSLLIMALIIGSTSISAQKAAITGLVIDSDSLYSISNVSVFLLDANQKVISRTTTDNKGLFSFTNQPLGNYKIRTIAQGYKVMISKQFSVTNKNLRNNFKIKIMNLEQGEANIFNDMEYNDYLDLLEDRELIDDK